MNDRQLKVGILFSLTGTTSITEKELLKASLLAIRQINESGGINGKHLIPIIEDVASDPFVAARKAEKLIVSDKVTAIVGIYTSGCRKTVIPVLEKYNALLFYPTFYEGGEQHPNIVYCGSLPNQQLLDYIPWLIGHVGKTFYLIGSDYIYPIETNNHIRDLIKANGGAVLEEQYVPLGRQSFDKIIDEIRQLNPDVIFSTLVGDSALKFYQQHKEEGLQQPIASTILAETEIAAIHPLGAQGHYSCFPYFSSIDDERNKKFISEFEQTYGTDVISSMMENAYNSVFLLAEALKRANAATAESIRKALSGLSLDTPQGKIKVDISTQHLWLHSRIGKVNEDGRFTIVWESGKPIKPMPFLKHEESDVILDPESAGETINIKSRMMRHHVLMTELKKSLSDMPFLFGYFDEEGVLLETFNHEQTHIPHYFSKLKPGDYESGVNLEKSGIGLALENTSAPYVITKEIEGEGLPYEIMIAGLPINGKAGIRIGVLGVWLPGYSQTSIEPILISIKSIINLCVSIADNEVKQQRVSSVLSGISNYVTESLFVIEKGAVLFQNQMAKTLYKRSPDLVNSIIGEFALEQSKETENEVRIIRREDSHESYEIKVICKNGMNFIYFKPLHRQKSRISITERSSMTTNDLIGSNDSFLQTVKVARSAAKTEANVLLLGESGTGKEMFARAIHNESLRSDQPFVALNCASISKDLIYSELFGYVEGAFTGAKKGGSPGKFEIADGGTLFLDEIGDMPIELQAILLRVLQEKEIERVGGHKSIPVDVRIIAATNKNLLHESAYNGSFRSDLFYRLNVFTIELIPLRKRIGDIAELSRYYLAKLSAETGQTEKVLSEEALSVLKKYRWPGNIRELNNVIERAFHMAGRSPVITAEQLPKSIVQHSNDTRNDLKANDQERDDNFQSAMSIKEIKQKIDENERELYVQTLMGFKGNVSKAAKHLGISRTTLYRKLADDRKRVGKITKR